MNDKTHKLKHPEAASTFPDFLIAIANNSDRATGDFNKKKAAKDFEAALHHHPDPSVHRNGLAFTPGVLAATEDQMEAVVGLFASLANLAATSQTLDAEVSKNK